ncbi:MAG: trypsin-like peptidase domain-containing protein [Treponemataceae bacterium]|nr:trypsin-like peptidase domain-containing protein [Treponemataceae bacterium]
MKLYSRTQVVIISIICIVIAVFATYFSINYFNGNLQNKKSEQEISSNEENSQVGKLNENPENDFYTFQTNLKQIKYSSNFDETYTQDEIQNISVYEKCSDAVVNISTKVISYSWFYEPYPTDGGSGSGSIIDKRGYVVTNRHVIKDAYKIYISLSDGTQYEGTLVGEDAQTDLAVVKFTPPENIELTTIGFSDSSKLRVGQKVIAIGNPFGFDRTMTTGIISSLGRPIQSNNTIFRDMIQTDTAINPGNSGGPLFDTQGRMIGINTMIYSTSGSSAGVGFAIPVNTAKRIVSDIMKYGKVKRGSLNISAIQISSTLSRYIDLPVKEGLLVSEVEKNSNASKAGLKGGTEAVRFTRTSQIFYIGGDIITAINGTPVSSSADYNSVLENTKPGDTAIVSIIRGSERIDLKIVLEEQK